MLFRLNHIVTLCLIIILLNFKFITTSNPVSNENNGLLLDKEQENRPHLLVSTIDGGLHLLELDKTNNRLNKLWQNGNLFYYGILND
jgi:hypothetical protein